LRSHRLNSLFQDVNSHTSDIESITGVGGFGSLAISDEDPPPPHEDIKKIIKKILIKFLFTVFVFKHKNKKESHSSLFKLFKYQFNYKLLGL